MATVAFVGRPSVGKSTLFNRVVGARVSIVDKTPNVTRDRIYGTTDWLTVPLNVIDTGGLSAGNVPFKTEIAYQVGIAVEEADVVVMVVSARDGLTPDDAMVAATLKKARAKRVVVCANKADTPADRANAAEFARLGFGEPVATAAAHGLGVGDLLDGVVKKLGQEATKAKAAPPGRKLAVVGRPNVGKSSLVNALLGEERSIVSPVPGTTRDATDTPFKRNGKDYVVIDTAGIRRKGKVQEDVEKYSVLRAQAAIARCDAILFVVDGSQPLQEQDEVVGGLVQAANLPTVIVVNKWDAVPAKTATSMPQLQRELRSRLLHLEWAPMVFISAKDNRRIDTIFAAFDRIDEQMGRAVPPGALTSVVAKAVVINQPPRVSGKRADFGKARQLPKTRVPTFEILCNDAKLVHFAYARFLENQIRQAFGLTEIPIALFFKGAAGKSLV